MYQTEQEEFWAGEFGDQYIARNTGSALVGGNLNLFSRVLSRTSGVSSLIEFGANIGNNLRAIAQLLPDCELAAVEINAAAAQQLAEALPAVHLHHSSLLEFEPDRSYDVALTKGVLIHINPDALPVVYDKLYAASSRYLVVCEYYSPVPQEIGYRGHDGKLFKRDFAGDLLERHPDLALVDYGFNYRRDPVFPMDDLTWFLLEKRG
ncbi:MAG: pseudaminic acid biosynthesis-associated methylase [Propionicimonas sp.]|nr:methyltransferase [Propionicimonas sp.]